MPFIADVTEEENQHLIHYFLNNALASKTVETGADFLDLSDVKYVSRKVTKNLHLQNFDQFLSSVEAMSVKMLDATSKLIRNYFVASRRARAIGGSVDECLPIGALQSMLV